MFNQLVNIEANNFKFKLEIKSEDNSLLVCIKCIDETCAQDNECLLSVMVNVDTSNNERTAILSDYYSHVLRGMNGASSLSSKLSGCIYAILCILLNCAIDQSILQMNDTIIVQESSVVNLETHKFYERLGFKYNYSIKRLTGKVEDVIKVCNMNKDKISKELITILDKVIN